MPRSSTTISLAWRRRPSGCVAALMTPPRLTCSARAETCAAMRSAISCAESSGRLSDARSAPGMASAWSAVSISPGSIDTTLTPSPFQFEVPDPGEVLQRRLARTVSAPVLVGGDGRVTRDIDHKRPSPIARRGSQRPEQRFGEAERPEHVGRERQFEVFALSVGERRPVAPARATRRCSPARRGRQVHRAPECAMG